MKHLHFGVALENHYKRSEPNHDSSYARTHELYDFERRETRNRKPLILRIQKKKRKRTAHTHKGQIQTHARILPYFSFESTSMRSEFASK